MRLQLTITMLAAMAAFPLAAADNPKPETKADVAPTLPSTVKFWMRVAKAQGAQLQLNESPAGKALAKANEDVQEAQAELAKACGGDKFVLGYGPDGDLACVAKAKPPAAPTDPTKEK